MISFVTHVWGLAFTKTTLPYWMTRPKFFYTPCNGGHWVVTKYELLRDLLTEPKVFSATETQIPRTETPTGLIPLNLDPPESLQYRALLMGHFSAASIRELEPRIREWAAKLVDSVVDDGRADFVDAISSRFPVSVFMEFMGLPMAGFKRFRELAETYFQPISSDERQAISRAVIEIMDEQIEDRRASPQDDLITTLVQSDLRGRKLTQIELQKICYLLFLAGLDTVTNVLSFSYRALGARPELQARLAANPDEISKFVDEAVRMFGVVNVPRLVKQDVDRFGVRFRAGDMVLCTIPIVGRDRRLNADPNVMDIDREKIVDLTFSTGPHICIGHMLARTEIRILTEEWFKRISRFSLGDGDTPVLRAGTVMSIDRLPLKWSV